jgi:tRNA threonylcarbamoyl adenosine modification protein YeaZ
MERRRVKQLYTLYIDTSSKLLHLGLEDVSNLGSPPPSFESYTCKEGLCEELPQSINSICDMQNIAPSEITQLVCCLGPGSYTGLRTGLAFCEGFSFSASKSILGVSLLLARGYAISKVKQIPSGQEIQVSVQASKAEIFVSSFTFFEGSRRHDSIASGVSVQTVDSIAARETIHRVDDEYIPLHPAQALSMLYTSYLDDPASKDPGFSFPRSFIDTHHVAVWGFGDNTPDPLYIKGVGAKTLKERGIELR